MTDRFVDLLRHGEAEGRACFRGRRDDPLSASGWQQMARALAAPDAPGWTRILTAPARRCAGFACQRAADWGVPLTVLDAFAERDFGDWEGRPAPEIPADQLRRFWADPVGYTPPGAEPFAAFRDRVLNAWDGVAADTDPAHTLLVTHGGVIRVIVAAVLRMPDAALLLLEVPPACRTRLRLPPPPGQVSIVFHQGICRGI